MSAENDRTLPMSSPPISASTRTAPQEELLQGGVLEPPAVAGTVGQLGRFEVLKLIGEGGMGHVFLAREPLTGAHVAVKVLKPGDTDNPDAVHRFRTAARHMYQLSHPGILRVLEVSDLDHRPFYVTPHIAGGSLQKLCIPGNPASGDRILPIARQVAEALAYSHSRGIVHRDLKPANVLVDTDGNTYLTDFGLVRTVFNDSFVDPSLGLLEGTAPYMSPAVARGEAEDTRCDIYAFGALLYELLTGQPPYTGRSAQMIISQVIEGPPQPIRRVNPKADPHLVQIAEGCMARTLSTRYASMRDVVVDLERASRKQAPLGPHQQAGSGNWRRLAAVAAAALVALGLTAIALRTLSVHRAEMVRRGSADRPDAPGAIPSAAVLPAGERAPAVADQAPDAPTAKEVVGADDDTPAGLAAGPGAAGNAARPTAGGEPKAQAQGVFDYTVADGKATLTKYTGPGGKVEIPATIGGVPVTAIGRSAFENCVSLTDVRIPDGITEIADGAFRRCTDLAALTIPRSVTNIAGNALNVCTKLTRVEVDAANPAYCSDADGVVFSKDKTTLVIYPSGKPGNYTVPNSVVSIGFAAFAGSHTLTSLLLPASVLSIGPYAFGECTGLTGIRIPDSVTSIGESAFWGCTSLPDISIPGRVTELPSFAFASCRALTSIRVPASVIRSGANPFRDCYALTDIVVDDDSPGCCSVDGVLFDKQKLHLIAYPNARAGSYRVPSGVTTIDQSSFRRAGKVTSVVLPPSVTSVDYRAFRGCGNVGGFFFEGNAPVAGPDAFSLCGSSTVYHLAGTTGWGKDFGGRPTAVWDPDKPFTYTSDKKAITITRYAHPDKKVTIPAVIDNLPVTTIGPGAFRNARHVTSIGIPDSVTRIGRSAFEGCVSLTSLQVPDSVVRIEPYAFNGCGALADIKLPAKLLNLEQGVLQGCAALAKVGIPETVIGIADAAFNGCAALTGIEIPAHVLSIGGNAFVHCPGLTAITVKAGNPAFCTVDGVLFSKDKTVLAACPNARTGEYRVPDGVTAIGPNAFETCAELTNITIPATVTSMGPAVFKSCAKLAGVKLPAGLTAIGAHAFYGCPELTSMVIPEKVTSIGDLAFYRCSKLVDVKLPAHLTSIGGGAFNGCVSLSEVQLPARLVGIGHDAFYNCPGLREMVIPASVKDIGGTFGNVFALSTGITAFSVAAGNSAFCTVDGVLFNKAKTELVGYPAGRQGDYVVPAGTKSIRQNTFVGHPSLTRVTIPEGVERIEAWTFGGCAALTTATLPASLKAIGYGAFSGSRKMAAIYFQGDAPTVHETAFGGQSKSTVYYRAGTKDWGKESGGRPTAVWDGKTVPTGQEERK